MTSLSHEIFLLDPKPEKTGDGAGNRAISGSFSGLKDGLGATALVPSYCYTFENALDTGPKHVILCLPSVSILLVAFVSFKCI